MKANGLNLICKNSTTTPYYENKDGEVELFISNHFKEKSFWVAYLDYMVLIGKWENNLFHYGLWNDDVFTIYAEKKIQSKFIQKFRLFNVDQELLLWRTRSGLQGRLRKDSEADDESKVEVVVANQVLFGTDVRRECRENFTEITENRGTTLVLPFSNLKVDEKQNRIFIKTHNYLGYNEAYQATYVDCRFVGFVNNGN